jgi:Putative porin
MDINTGTQSELRGEDMKRFSLNVLKTAVLAGLLTLPLPAWAADDLTDLLVQKGTISKEEADSLQKRVISSAIDKITFYGDFRLREETFWYPGKDNNSADKNRQRIRLRIGTDITEGPVMVHIRLASGTSQQVSTNQTLQDLSTQKPLWIDKAYVEVRKIPDLVLAGGRMSNPFFVNWLSGEIVFDDDYNPEGFAEQYVLKLGENGKVFANLGQVILDNGDASRNSQWLLGEQIGTEMKMDPVGFNAAVLFYSLANGTKTSAGPFDASVYQDGNTRVPPVPPATTSTNALANPFSVVDGTVAVMFKAGLPITVSADAVKNLQDTVESTTPSIKNENTAMAFGLKIGKAGKANTAEFAYTYRSIDADAVLADINDSDFGPNGGTNRKGHSAWVAYDPTDSTQVKLKYINSKIKNEDLLTTKVPGSDPNPTFNRVQLDFSVKF